MNGRILIAAALTLIARPATSPAAPAAAQMPLTEGASRVQRFRYDPEASFAILALPGVPTDLQLGPDEHVTGFALGDTLQWMVEELPGHVFVKPLKPDLFTAGTLVTDRRTYQLTLRSGRGHEDWMQRVSWSYPEVVVLRSAAGGPSRAPEAAADAVRVPALPPSSTLPAPAPGVDPARLDFDYGISGEAPFRPLAVFDDGRATWLRIPGHDLLPVLYGEDAEGERMVHYAVRGDWLIAARIAPSWVLRAGNAMVRIERHPGGPAHAQRPPPAFWR